MKRFYAEVGDNKWAFIFSYDIEDNDVNNITNWLRSLGANDNDIQRSQHIILGKNKGLTFSNDNLRMSVMCISNATSEEEWWNTVVHEIYHIQHTICSYYDIEPGQEECAYLQGELMRLIMQGIRRTS